METFPCKSGWRVPVPVQTPVPWGTWVLAPSSSSSSPSAPLPTLSWVNSVSTYRYRLVTAGALLYYRVPSWAPSNLSSVLLPSPLCSFLQGPVLCGHSGQAVECRSLQRKVCGACSVTCSLNAEGVGGGDTSPCERKPCEAWDIG